MLSADIKIKESDDKIAQLILGALKTDINFYLLGVAKKIEPRIQNLIRMVLLNCPEMVALRSGDLRSELGVLDAEQKIDAIVNVWISNIKAVVNTVRVVGKALKGGLIIEAIQGDFTDVLSMDEANQLTAKGEILPWLEWMLTYGSSAIIKDYTLAISPRVSRTGHFIMKPQVSTSWHIPPQYAGTIHDNFVTRALESIQDEIDNILYDALKA